MGICQEKICIVDVLKEQLIFVLKGIHSTFCTDNVIHNGKKFV